jgi:hypothetical protein
MFQSWRLAYKSNPEVGSSSTTNLELPHNAIATESFRLFPPDN